MLADMEAGKLDGIVFVKLDRLVRDHGDFERVMRAAEAGGAVLACVKDAIDTTTATGEAAARMLVMFARLESQTTGLRVAEQRRQAALAGKPRPGANRPFGYELDRVTVIPEERDAAQHVAKMLLAGESLRNATRYLNDHGILAPAGGQWTTIKLRRTLLAPHLTGLRSYHGEIVAEGQWEAVLARDIWERVGQLLRDPKRRKGGRPPRWLLVGGLSRCGRDGCGAPLIVRNDGRGVACYVCESGQARPGWRGCGRLSIRADLLEEVIVEAVILRLAGGPLAKIRKALAAKHQDLAAVAETLAADERSLVELGHARFVTREIDHRPYLEAKQDLDERIARAYEQLAADRRTRSLVDLPETEEELRQAFGVAEDQDPAEVRSVDWRRTVLDACIEQITVLPATSAGRRPKGMVDPERIDVRWWV
jgi:hypothetical protein